MSINQDLCQRLQRFYTRQVHAIDSGDFDGYRDSFTADAEFSVAGLFAVQGAAVIAEQGRSLAAARAGRVVQRHHVTMTGAWRRPDGSIAARSSTLIISTPVDGSPAVSASTTCADEFSDVGGTLRVRHRLVSRDGAGSGDLLARLAQPVAR